MKVIFSRIFIEKVNGGSIIQDRTSLLVWILSVLKWKQFGYGTIFYTDETTKNEFEKIGILKLYDEVKIIKSDIDINEEIFWTCSKILSAKQFMEEYPNEEFMISDLDFIPLKDPFSFKTIDNEVLTFYQEYVPAYCPLKYLNLNNEYELPSFFTGKVDPINACFLYIQKSNLSLFRKYLDIEIDFMNCHRDFISILNANDLMMFVEQRMFTEYLVSNDIPITPISPRNKSVFNTSGIHTGPYKNLENTDYWKWNIWWLKLIKEEFPEVYDEVISLELYKDIKEIIDACKGNYYNKLKNETIITDFNWDTLEYPRAFEDIYNPKWNK